MSALARGHARRAHQARTARPSAPAAPSADHGNAAAAASLEPVDRVQGGGLLDAMLAEGSPGGLPYQVDLERAFGEDLSDVQVVTGAKDTLAGLGARAAAFGELVAFADVNPDKETVAHEIAHVVQGRSADTGIQAKAVSGPGDGAERQADEAAASVVRGDGEAAARVSEQPVAGTAAVMRKAAPGVAADKPPGGAKTPKPPEGGGSVGVGFRQIADANKGFNKTRGQMNYAKNLDKTKHVKNSRTQRTKAKKEMHRLNAKNHADFVKSSKLKVWDKAFSKNAYFPLPLGGLMAKVGFSGQCRGAPKTGFEDNFSPSKAEGKYNVGYEVSVSATLSGGLAMGVPWANISGTLDTALVASGFAGGSATIKAEKDGFSGDGVVELNASLEGHLNVTPTVTMVGKEYKYPINLAKYKFAEFNPKFGLKWDKNGPTVDSLDAKDFTIKSPFLQSSFYKWLSDDDKAHDIVQGALKKGTLDKFPADVKAMLFSRIRDSVVLKAHEGSLLALLHATEGEAARWSLVEQAYRKQHPSVTSPTRKQLQNWLWWSIDNHWGARYWDQAKTLLGIR